MARAERESNAPMTPLKHTALVTALLALLGNPMHAGAAENTVPAAWYPQRVITADFAFFVHATVDQDERYAVDAIRILDRKSGSVVQQIDHVDAMAASGTPDELLFLVDADADGRPDLSLPISAGGMGPGVSTNIYLFNTRSGSFELHEQLSELDSPAIGRDGTIITQSRDSGFNYQYASYRLEHGKRKQIGESSESAAPNGDLIIHSRQLVRGKWRTARKRVRAPSR